MTMAQPVIIHEREVEELPVHVAACAERYTAFYSKLDAVDKKTSRLEKMVWILIVLAAAQLGVERVFSFIGAIF